MLLVVTGAVDQHDEALLSLHADYARTYATSPLLTRKYVSK